MSVIELSSLYSVSLDNLLKGDQKMIEHLKENTDIVKSSKKLIAAIICNILLASVLIALSFFIPENRYYLIGVFCMIVISASALLYQIIKRF